MRFVTFYLIGYAVLVTGAFFALWAGGALPHIGTARLLVAFGVAVGLGLLLAFASDGFRVTNEDEDEDEDAPQSWHTP